MQWWDNLIAWLDTDSGRLVLLGGVVPFIAILVAGLLAAWIARASVRRMLARRDRESRAAVIGLLVDSARQASVWSSSSPSERTLIERAVAEADLALRLLPARGARLAAEWAAHEIAGLRRASAVFSLEFDQPLADFRDRLISWHRRPRRARKLFEADLIRWRAEASDARNASDGEPLVPAVAVPSGRAAQQAPSARIEPAIPDMQPAVPHAPRTETSVERGEPGQVEPPTDEEFARPVARAGGASPEA
ncbi:hypothetical protein [Naasia sp. SYSU D00948]|uniref:hypothetical protein n=1 Tax=Naasia sp. SYSU D00948 TaxID=2817379 RepID=UPI001B3094FA|nr:hypothetical protein [Naasia sp. SYSU D00948]